MVGLERGQVPAHSAARLMAVKKRQHKVITFMYNITYYLLAKIDIIHMGYNPTSELCDILHIRQFGRTGPGLMHGS